MIADVHTFFVRIVVRHSLTVQSALKFAGKLYDGPAARYFNEILSGSVASGSSLSVTDVLDAMERYLSTPALRQHAGAQAPSLRISPDGSQVEAAEKFIGEWTESITAADVEMRSDSVQLQFLSGAITDVSWLGPLRLSLKQSDVLTFSGAFERMRGLALDYDQQSSASVNFGRHLPGRNERYADYGHGRPPRAYRSSFDSDRTRAFLRAPSRSGVPFDNGRLGRPKNHPGPDGKPSRCRSCHADYHYAYSPACPERQKMFSGRSQMARVNAIWDDAHDTDAPMDDVRDAVHLAMLDHDVAVEEAAE